MNGGSYIGGCLIFLHVDLDLNIRRNTLCFAHYLSVEPNCNKYTYFFFYIHIDFLFVPFNFFYQWRFVQLYLYVHHGQPINKGND